MEIGLAPSALPSLINLASQDSSSVLRTLVALQAAAGHDRGKKKHAELQALPLDSFPGCSLGYVVESGLPVVLSVCETDELNASLSRLHRFKNWHEHVVRMDINGLQPRELGRELYELAVFLSPDRSSISRTYPFDTCAFHWQQGSFPFRASNRAYRAEAANTEHVHRFLDKLNENAQTWKTGDARKEFAGLMSSATDRPQIVSRPDGERVYIVAEGLLEHYVEPLSAPELVAAFCNPPIPLTLKRAARPSPRQAPSLRVSPPDDRIRST